MNDITAVIRLRSIVGAVVLVIMLCAFLRLKLHTESVEAGTAQAG